MNWQLIRCAFGKHTTVEVGCRKETSKKYWIWPQCSYCKQPMNVHSSIWQQMKANWDIEKWGNPYKKILRKNELLKKYKEKKLKETL